jgi:hypothetical protein
MLTTTKRTAMPRLDPEQLEQTKILVLQRQPPPGEGDKRPSASLTAMILLSGRILARSALLGASRADYSADVQAVAAENPRADRANLRALKSKEPNIVSVPAAASKKDIAAKTLRNKKDTLEPPNLGEAAEKVTLFREGASEKVTRSKAAGKASTTTKTQGSKTAMEAISEGHATSEAEEARDEEEGPNSSRSVECQSSLPSSHRC